MADSDLALAMAIAENSDSSQDEDFQLPTHAGQLCILNKLAHPPKRQKKVHCLSKKKTVLHKPQRISMEGKENQDQGNCGNGISRLKCNFADPDLSQVRRPLAARTSNVRNGTPSPSAGSALVKDQVKKAEIADKAMKPFTSTSTKDYPSETVHIAASETSTGSYSSSPPDNCPKVAVKTPLDFQTLASDGARPSPLLPSSYHHHQNQANVTSHMSVVDGNCGGSTKPSAHDHHKKHACKAPVDSPRIPMEEVMLETLKAAQNCERENAIEEPFKPQQNMPEMAQTPPPRPSPTMVQGLLHHSESKDGDLLVAILQGNTAFSSMDEVISLAEEEDLMIDVTEKKQQRFEPDCVQQEKFPSVEYLSSANINPDSQFNALLNLCISSASNNNEVDDLHADSLGNSLAAEDGSLEVEELISSLMTQNRCREFCVPCDVDLQIEAQSIAPEVLPKSNTEKVTTTLLIASQNTCLEAQKLSFEVEDCSDHEQDSDGQLYGEGSGVCVKFNLEQPLECPVCGSCITSLSFEQREVHTNACLDSIDRKETHEDAELLINDTDQTKLDGKSELGECVQENGSLDLTPVLCWLETLNLSRYADVFVREEIDWDTLKCLADEDLCTLGITALGPRRKILHALQQLEKGRHENSTNTMNQGAENKQQVEADTTGKKRITDFFELPPSLQGKGASGPQTEPANKHKAGGSSGLAARKRILTELGGIPEWMSIPGTKFRVDAFRHLRADCSHWFLTHFHTDHYQGLTRAFRYGHVYCSPITAQLVNTRIGVPWERLKSVPLNQTTEIDGVKVTFMDANHCPGSVMILFEPQNGKAVLHTGDFRFCEDMARSSVLQACNFHTLMLDTTYCNPQYDFPKQEAAIQFIIDAIQAEAFNPSTLFLIGTYTIGKERIFFEVAKALQKKIYCSATKLRLLQCMNFSDEDMKWLTTNEPDAYIHVVPLWSIASFKRMSYIVRHNAGRYNSIISFSPTGWSFGRGKKRTPGRRLRQGTIVRYEVPYSEHCSFKELRDFVRFINPVNIIPSVHNDSAEAADALIALLLNEEEG